MNLLEELRALSQVDLDSVDIEVAKNLGPFVDSTSNQADFYFELSKPKRLSVLKTSIALAKNILHEYPSVTLVELGVELSMCFVALEVVPYISGSIHIMANPTYSHSTSNIIENSKRIASFCRRLNPSFDLSRLCIKVPSTFEGLQACRQLKDMGIRTLATTLFTMEQAILAGEVGCVSISPFVHELRVHFDESYQDEDPNFLLCVQAQKYYEENSYETRVKACSVVSIEEVMLLAGVNALTIAPSLLEELKQVEWTERSVNGHSLFLGRETEIGNMDSKTFINNEKEFRERFGKSQGGKGEKKTEEAIQLFCEFQTKCEELLKPLL
ncbi:hypothetical protein HYFRA_00002207 [Hymenoscyphus fraxineus]|uniref:Transaldolase n=1 Tax=Hymenoscyphus fraxineus TaxID=746836 RepID=A0A9N9KLV9_9HELO|nr:hypothetical protein HYFRA_00002207 [Hymenoscyphus fraxineus]